MSTSGVTVKDPLETVCGDIPFWDDDGLFQDTPVFSPCFEDTLLVWIPHGILWIGLIPYVVVITERHLYHPLPWTKLQIAKTAINVALFCLALSQIGLTPSAGYRCIEGAHIPKVTYFAAGLRTASFLLMVFLEQYVRVLGIRSSSFCFFVWFTIATSDIVRMYSVATAPVWCVTSSIYSIIFALIWTQLFLRCFADQRRRDARDKRKDKKEQCPDKYASALSVMTFHWMTELVMRCHKKKNVTLDDMWQQADRLKSKRAVNEFITVWDNAKADIDKNIQQKPTDADRLRTRRRRLNSENSPLLGNGFDNSTQQHYDAIEDIGDNLSHKKPRHPSLFRVLFKTFGPLLILPICFKLFGDMMSITQPHILGKLMDVIEGRDNPETRSPEWLGYAWVAGLVVAGVLKNLMWQLTYHHVMAVGLRTKNALVGAIYRKALTLSNSGRKSSTVGEIVNIMSVDCQRVFDSFYYTHFAVSFPIVIIASLVQIWMFMGPAMFGGIIVIIVTILVMIWMGKVQEKIQRRLLNLKGKRIKLLNEVIAGIKVLKMYTWELPFQEAITNIRNQEIKQLTKFAIVNSVSIMITMQGGFLIMYGLIVTYTQGRSVHYIDARTVFVTMAFVTILGSAVVTLQFVVNACMQSYVSLLRIQRFLWKDDIDAENITITWNSEHAIRIERGCFSWDVEQSLPTLRNISVQLPDGGIYAVVGQVGSGKSSLIAAILGEMYKLDGHVTIKGNVAYVPQEAWIQNMSIRDNIVFGSVWNQQWYERVIAACALAPDLDMLPAGDMTEIGEKGINLSGGQKQRVSLARAVYNDADVYLFDDPLSAVDAHVGKHLFNNVIGPQGLLKNKTRLLVTHGLHWLPMVDKILVLTDGRISESGTYGKLMSSDGALSTIVQTYLQNTEEDNDDSPAQTGKQGSGKRLQRGPRFNAAPQQLPRYAKTCNDDADDEGDEMTGPALNINAESDDYYIKRVTRLLRDQSHSPTTHSKTDQNGVGGNAEMEKGKLLTAEISNTGSIKFSVLKMYLKALGYMIIPMSLVAMVAFQTFNVYANFWLTYWTEDPLLKNLSLGNTPEYEARYLHYLTGYTVLGLAQGVCILLVGLVILTQMVRASGVLHNNMLRCLLRSPMSFYDTTPIGRIINRFTVDIDIMDNVLPMTYRMWNNQLFMTLSTIVVVAINTPLSLAIVVPLCGLYVLLLNVCFATLRQTKRLQSVLRSPIFNHFSETISGVSVIRAYRCVDMFMEEAFRRMDRNGVVTYASLCAVRWVTVRLDSLGAVVILVTGIFSLQSDTLNSAEAGLSVTYALQITVSLALLMHSITSMQMNAVSAERIAEYTELQSEAPWTISESTLGSDWPRTGSIEFRAYSARYREGLELTLRGIRCKIKSGEKIGIVGRTGAGKSSLVLSLFRLCESAGGAIFLDGQNIADIGLHDLRDKLTILPQDPVIFSGTLRDNLDPFNKFDDERMWRALESAHMKSAVSSMPGQLSYECGEAGSNLSAGQRQLVCLARTLLHKTRILILDEATAAVDLETDDLIQTTIRKEFSDCTILTIAHRINTVLDYDRIMVLSEGRIIEMDKPQRLLSNPNSAFYKMAQNVDVVS